MASIRARILAKRIDPSTWAHDLEPFKASRSYGGLRQWQERGDEAQDHCANASRRVFHSISILDLLGEVSKPQRADQPHKHVFKWPFYHLSRANWPGLKQQEGPIGPRFRDDFSLQAVGGCELGQLAQ